MNYKIQLIWKESLTNGIYSVDLKDVHIYAANYKVGDKIIINKPDESEPDSFLWFDDFMDKFDGKECTISEINDDKEFVHVEEDDGWVPWTFSFKWIVPVNDNKDDGDLKGYRKTNDDFWTNDDNWNDRKKWLV